MHAQDLRRQFELKNHQLEQTLRKQMESLQLDGLMPEGERSDTALPKVPHHSGINAALSFPSDLFTAVDLPILGAV